MNTSPSVSNINDNTPATARNIGVLRGTYTNQDFIGLNRQGQSDPVDWYRFSIQQISELNYTITGTPSNAGALFYYDANNNGRLDTSEEISLTDFDLKAMLPGNYFIRVGTSLNGSSNYNLRLSLRPTPGNLSRDPGNSFATALDITSALSAGSFNAVDYASSRFDPFDFYRFTLTQQRTLNTTLMGSPQSATAVMFLRLNSDGTASPGDGSLGYFIEGIPRILRPGTYFFRAASASTNLPTRYQLRMRLS